MQRRKVLLSQIVKFLKDEPNGLSQLALMCLCHGYRYTHKKLLFFSVVERTYLQAEQFGDAEQLLEKMLGEADAYYDSYKAKLRVKEAKRRRQLEAIKAYNLVKPPKEVVIRPAEKRLVSGNPAFSQKDWGVLQFSGLKIAAAAGILPSIKGLIESTQGYPTYANIPDDLKEQIVGQGLLADSLQPPRYETIPEERGPSSYAILEDELEQRLKNYPKVVWQKLESERDFAKDDEVTRQILVARQATRRALQALLEDGEVTVEGKGAAAIYRLASEPS